MLSIQQCEATCNVYFYKNKLHYQQKERKNSGLFICVLKNEQTETVWHEMAKSIQWYFKWASLSSRPALFEGTLRAGSLSDQWTFSSCVVSHLATYDFFLLEYQNFRNLLPHKD